MLIYNIILSTYLKPIRQHYCKLSFTKIIFLGLLAAVLSGCLPVGKHNFVEKKQYLLSLPDLSMQKSIQNPKKQNFFLYPSNIVSAFDQNYFLYRKNKTQYLIDYYHSFLTSPTHQLDTALINSLNQSKRWNLLSAQNKNLSSYQLHTKIIELYADYREPNHPKAIITIHFVLTAQKDLKNIVLLDKTFHTATALKTKTTESLVDAWSDGLQNILNTLNKNLNNIKL